MIGIGVIGCGYWGPNLVRNFAELEGSRVVAVSDFSADRLRQIERRYPSVQTTTDYRALLANRDIDVIAIATPVATHHQLALDALRAGKHVLVEKPLAASVSQALQLCEEAEKRGRVLMVDHTYIYTGAVRKIKEMVSSGDVGEVNYYTSTRVNLGLFQHDVNVLWDLAVHDLAIMDFVLGQHPVAVSATGMMHVQGQLENIAFMTLFYAGSLIAHVHVNWLAPVKIRHMHIGGSRKMIVYDDLEPSEKIMIYDKGITITDDPASIYQMLIGYRTGDMHAPQVDRTEALQTAALHLLDCIENRKRPHSDGFAGLRVVAILEAATQSMAKRGQAVELASFGGPS